MLLDPNIFTSEMLLILHFFKLKQWLTFPRPKQSSKIPSTKGCWILFSRIIPNCILCVPIRGPSLVPHQPRPSWKTGRRPHRGPPHRCPDHTGTLTLVPTSKPISKTYLVLLSKAGGDTHSYTQGQPFAGSVEGDCLYTL